MPEGSLQLATKKRAATRDGFGRAMLELAAKHDEVVALTADLRESMRLTEYAERYPERFCEMGVAEQNMVSVAVGLSTLGFVPFAASFATFVPGRTFDHIRIQVAYGQANVKLVGGHTGISVGADGATHQMLEDIAMMRALPNMTVIVPTDAEEARKATVAAAASRGPVYLRLGREEIPQFTTPSTPFAIGEAYLYRRGSDVSVIATGTMTWRALVVAEQLAGEGISVEVIHVPTIKPLDEGQILHSAVKTKRVVVCEEAQVAGGLAGAVAELLAERAPTPMVRVGVLDRFGQSGAPAELMVEYGLDTAAIAAAVKKMLR